MNSFINIFNNALLGVLCGFDRVMFQGHILPLMYPAGAMSFFDRQRILYKDAKDWFLKQTIMLTEAVHQWAMKECGEGIIYLPSSNSRKEAIAREQQEKKGIETGLIGVWSCVESCRSYKIIRSEKKPVLQNDNTRCKHLYLYFEHPIFGFMHIRIQTWFPYKIQIAMNGREWLSRQLKAEGIGFERHRNKFLYIDDFDQAQKLLNQQLDTEWCKTFNNFLHQAFPTMESTLGPNLSYTWTCWQSEWATDFVFKNVNEVPKIIENQVQHAFMTGHAGCLFRYFGRPVNAHGEPRKNYSGSIQTNIKDINEGVRIRHWIDSNSVKLYNEQNTIRIETTINQPSVFKVHRRKQGDEADAPKQRLPLRKGVADIVLRAQVSQDVNNRFAENLCSAKISTSLDELLQTITQAKNKNGRRVRALDPIGKDKTILDAVSSPEFTIAGFGNKDIRKIIFDKEQYKHKTDKQLSGTVSRLFRILRDHGIIRKLPKQNRYLLTSHGRQFTSAIQIARSVSIDELLKIAA